MAGLRVLLASLAVPTHGAFASAADLEELFNKNVERSTEAFGIDIFDEQDLSGLPSSELLRAAAAYRKHHAAKASTSTSGGPWRLTLESESIDKASQWNLLKYLDSRPLRKTLLDAFAQRASRSPYDNVQTVQGILALRHRNAVHVGHKTFADWKMKSQMLQRTEAVDSLVENMSRQLQPVVREDLEALQRFAAQRGHEGQLEAWDIDYWEERWRQERHSYDEEELMAYLPLPRVLSTLCNLTSTLFGIRIVEEEKPAEKAKKKQGKGRIRLHVHDGSDNVRLGSIYIDAHAGEENTRTLVHRYNFKGKKPVELISLDLARPSDVKIPPLLRLKNIESLFHEFGHATATMLTHRFEYDPHERDNMEVPSHFMECWMYHWPTFEGMAVHYLTNETLPRSAFDEVVGSAAVGAARTLLWAAARSALDMAVHARSYPASAASTSASGLELLNLERSVLRRIAAPLPDLREACWLCIFDHIFDGETYAANEYSYLWGQVIAFDAYAAFEEAGLENLTALKEVGQRFRRI